MLMISEKEYGGHLGWRVGNSRQFWLLFFYGGTWIFGHAAIGECACHGSGGDFK